MEDIVYKCKKKYDFYKQERWRSTTKEAKWKKFEKEFNEHMPKYEEQRKKILEIINLEKKRIQYGVSKYIFHPVIYVGLGI